ncbi:MAG: hypothetical protein K2J37_04715, partial [Ruminococcus sp.]|nr:hypothetical protein [Ruminococcus sp.]
LLYINSAVLRIFGCDTEEEFRSLTGYTFKGMVHPEDLDEVEKSIQSQIADSIYDFDVSKLSIYTLPIGLAGIEVYDLLRDEYDIQIEFGDLGNILAYLSVGDRKRDIERLISAMAEIKRRFGKSGADMLTQEYISPIVAEAPRRAFYADKISLPLDESVGRVCTEFVMCYPPGIPILAPGELITQDIISYIRYAKEKGCQMTGTEDINIERLNVLV